MNKLKILSVRDITFKEGCELYLDNCRERNLREGTIEHYKNSYKQLYKFFNPNMPISQINSDMYKKYVLYLRERISNDVSINAYLRDFITTMRFLMSEEYVPHFKLRAIKVDKPNVETYTEEELNCLLQKPNIKKCSFIEYQAWVMTSFLFSTGVRQRSLINILIKDIDFDNDILIEVLGTIAEQERLTIRQRQREGIDSAKEKGKHLGRPKASLPDNYDDIICLWKNGDITAKEAMSRLGIKKSTFYSTVRKG